MSYAGRFTEDDQDIVTLHRDSDEDPGHARRGWVNVGPFAVRISMTASGDLDLEVYPCQNENEPLARQIVMREAAIAAGGIDCDEGDQG